MRIHEKQRGKLAPFPKWPKPPKTPPRCDLGGVLIDGEVRGALTIRYLGRSSPAIPGTHRSRLEIVPDSE